MKTKSRVTTYTAYCMFCGRPTNEEHHFLFGSDRMKAEEDGIKGPACRGCHTSAEFVVDRLHDNNMAEKLSKMFGQAIWERNYCAEGHTVEEARKAFMKRYGKAYY